MIKAAKEVALKEDKNKRNVEYIMDEYSPLVSLLQKRRVLMALKEVARTGAHSSNVLGIASELLEAK